MPPGSATRGFLPRHLRSTPKTPPAGPRTRPPTAWPPTRQPGRSLKRGGRTPRRSSSAARRPGWRARCPAAEPPLLRPSEHHAKSRFTPVPTPEAGVPAHPPAPATGCLLPGRAGQDTTSSHHQLHVSCTMHQMAARQEARPEHAGRVRIPELQEDPVSRRHAQRSRSPGRYPLMSSFWSSSKRNPSWPATSMPADVTGKRDAAGGGRQPGGLRRAGGRQRFRPPMPAPEAVSPAGIGVSNAQMAGSAGAQWGTDPVQQSCQGRASISCRSMCMEGRCPRSGPPACRVQTAAAAATSERLASRCRLPAGILTASAPV